MEVFFTLDLIFAVLLVGTNFWTKPEYFVICVFNLNFLAVVVSEILGESQIYIMGAAAPGCPVAE